SRPEIETALRAAGMDPDSLPISVGRLIGLRGEVQHHGREVDDRLRAAFYEMEAVVRALIRQAAGIRNGWWAASDNAAAVAEPFDEAVSRLHGPGRSIWHDEQLPPAEAGEPERLPRKIPNPLDDPRISVDEDFADACELVAAVVVDALEWLDQEVSLDVH